MRKFLFLTAVALPLAACTTSPYGYGYGDPYRSGYGDPYRSGYGYGQNPILGAIGALGGAYGSSFSQAAVNACASVASRYGPVRITSVRQTSSSRMKVYGYAQRGYRSDNWDCTFRSDGRITDFDI